MAPENEMINTEFEGNEEEIEETETPAVEEETGEEKPFSEMTEDERMALPEDKLLEELEKEGESETETPPEEEDPEEEESEEEEDKSIEDKIRDGDNIEHEELEKATSDQRGRYYALQKERSKTQDAVSELEKVKAVQEGQLEVINNLKSLKGGEQGTQVSEYDKVMASIEAQAKSHEDETGEPADQYRPSLADQKALREAEKTDRDADQAKQAEDYNKQQQQRAVETFQQKIDEGVVSLTKEGIKDYDFVYKNFIEPQINPQIAKNPKIAIANAQILINLAVNGENPAKYAYENFAGQSEAGRKYFQEKGQKKVNKDLIDRGSKKTTKTSAHVEGARTPAKGEKVDMTILNGNFEYWEKKLSDEEFTKVVSGKTIYK